MNRFKKFLFIPMILLFSINNSFGDNYYNSPEEYVGFIAQETLDILGNSEKKFDDKVHDISDIFLSHLAVNEISLFVLGPYRRNLKKEKKDEYISLLKRFISEVYSIRLASYPSGNFKILKTTDTGRSGIIVKTQIKFLDNPNPIFIDWRLVKNKNGNFKIFDIRVIGVWMAQEQRSTFTAFLSKHDGSVEKLMERLRKQLLK
ncbi:MAG: ABC transporter substrate-binding protein [Pseudomonadota bacterium]|nr:ABC transporter substrate-binding protein [Pseudomonadota bacterium]MEC7831305.1 ABC transporter substrate-binding protein [Pseudomonadota bacterium]MEC9481659.1 ABC transporter substrate-binding protein [Pseudomonadota bacterium]